MRYIRKKIVETTMFDGDVTDLEEIRNLLTHLCEHETNVDLKLASEFCTYNSSRIVDVSEPLFTFVYTGNSSSIRREAEIKHLVYLKVVTNDQLTAKLKPEINRWHLISPADSDMTGSTPE